MNEQAKRAIAEGHARVLAKGRYLTLLDEHGWEYVTRGNVTGVVVIVALTPEGKLLLVEQPRTALHKRIIELPAGLVGDLEAGETLLAAAGRELVEETGYAAREMAFLAEGPVAVGLSDEVLTFFHARDLSRVGPGGGDETEDITVHEVPLPGLRRFLAARAAEGLAIDPKIYAGLFLLGVQVPA
ncbi:MAG TPA: NUDIX hydrolase [Polyangia bacterium]|nr:NUDIX hydrolase [Polyangia bacterium]